jgi:hypothetical protein
VAKRKPINMQIKEFEARLEKSDDLVKDLILAIKGSSSMNIQGALPLLQDMSKELKQAMKDISDIQRWRTTVEASKGMISIKTSVLITRVMALIGIVATAVGVFTGITQLIDWINK